MLFSMKEKYGSCIDMELMRATLGVLINTYNNLYKDIFMGKLSFNRGHKNLFNETQEEQWKIGDFCHIDDWCEGMVTKFL